MTKQTSLLSKRERGERARAILDDPLVKEVFAAIDHAVLSEWKDISRTPEERERLWFKYQALEDFREAFKLCLRTGEAAAKELAKEKDSE
jgi:hypothetical protein